MGLKELHSSDTSLSLEGIVLYIKLDQLLNYH